jgi:hypothetical protein
LAYHGGNDNGRLPVTYEQFVSYGIERHSIGPAIRECVALGFLEVTEHGCAGNAEFRSSNKFRLTYRPVKGDVHYGSNEWRRIESKEEALRLSKAARSETSGRRYRPSKGALKQNSSVGKTTLSMGKTRIKNDNRPVRKTPTTVEVGNPSLLSISRGGRVVNGSQPGKAEYEASYGHRSALTSDHEH